MARLWGKSNPRGGVYLAQATGTRRFKIGFSDSIPKRIDQLKTSNHNKVVLVAWIPDATMAREKELHELLAPYRTEGEWFELDPIRVALLILEDDFKATDAFAHYNTLREDDRLLRLLDLQAIGLDPRLIAADTVARELRTLGLMARCMVMGPQTEHEARATGIAMVPTGLEALSISLTGRGPDGMSIAESMNSIACALQEISAAIELK